MNKDIRYSGLSSVPSDYDAPDGQLNVSLGLLCEDGALRPLTAPVVTAAFPDGWIPLGIHDAPLGRYIILHSGSTLYALPVSENWPATPLPEFHEINDFRNQYELIEIDSFSNLPAGSMLTMGNIIIFPNEQKRYLLVTDKEGPRYRYIPPRWPVPRIDFAFFADAETDSDLVEARNFNIEIKDAPDNSALRSYLNEWIEPSADTPDLPTDEEAKTKATSILSDISNTIYAHLNKFHADARRAGRFTTPFFIRYALRLYDGSYVAHSAPILLSPCSNTIVGLRQSEPPTGSKGNYSFPVTISNYPVTLAFRFRDLDGLEDWADIVTSIDFFITPPIYSYDTGAPLTSGPRPLDTKVWAQYATLATGVKRPGTEDYPSSSPMPPAEACSIGLSSSHYPREWVAPGHFPLPSEKDLDTRIASSYIFRRILSIPLSDVRQMTNFAVLNLSRANLLTIDTLPAMDDDAYSRHIRIPHSATVYNSRLHFADTELYPFSGFPVESMSPYSVTYSGQSMNREIFVWLQRDGRSIWVRSHHEDAPGWGYNAHLLPRFLWYPDASATRMVIVDSDQYGNLYRVWDLKLQPHDFLNGSYWLHSFALEEEYPQPLEPHDGATPLAENTTSFKLVQSVLASLSEVEYIRERNRLQVSEVSNPFFFPLTGVTTVSSGRILALASAARPLSQGQFGQFPLYAFTTEGIWALEISVTGAYTARQPITRDVCTNTDGITQIDSAVLFPSDRGLMLLSGSQTQCITDNLTSENPFELTSLPGIDTLLDSRTNLGLFNSASRRDFFSNCSIIYDYRRSRITAFRADVEYAYIYSLKSKMWGMYPSTLVSPCAFYPEALAINNEGRIVDLSSTSGQTQPAIIVTRPLSLDAPDILKTITTIIQRGVFRNGQVKTVLYASRDLLQWHYVSSSKTHRIHNRLGTPYKYFRLLLICDLYPKESISGFTVGYELRFTNRLR